MATPCFFARTSTIFQCPKSALFSDTNQITFEQCVNEDVTASAYAIDPLVEGRPTITLLGVPPPKRTKRIWKKMIKSKHEFSARLLELAPDTFQYHQLETVQREQRSLLCPTYALSQPAANFNLATVRGHVLPSFQPHLNYFNNTKVKIPKEELCNIANHIYNKLHTQLIRFDKICCVCVGTTNSTNDYWVYDFKDTYSSLFEQLYKKTIVEVFGNYQV